MARFAGTGRRSRVGDRVRFASFGFERSFDHADHDLDVAALGVNRPGAGLVQPVIAVARSDQAGASGCSLNRAFVEGGGAGGDQLDLGPGEGAAASAEIAEQCRFRDVLGVGQDAARLVLEGQQAQRLEDVGALDRSGRYPVGNARLMLTQSRASR